MSQQRSIKYNFILNLINTVIGVIFPIITIPYISRVLGPGGFGLVGFNHSVINYIMTFSSLGIASYAVREVSRLKNDEHKQIHCSIEILSLHILLTIVAYVMVFILYFFVPQFTSNGSIFLILSIPILFNAIGVVWFFQAREEFRFILVRSLTVKIISLILLFALVKNSSDVVMYAAVLAFAEVANNFLNFMRLRKIVSTYHIEWKRIDFIRHLWPTTTIFAMGFVISLYLDLPSVFLGFVCGDDSVGYYITASRLTKVILTIVTALGTTLLPRMSHYFISGDITRFRELEQTGLQFIIGITLPISIALYIISPEVILCFAGNEFEPSIQVLRIISPTILIIGIAGIVGIQSLYSQGKEKIIIKSAISGFIISAVINILLTPHIAQNGASIAYLFAELTVTCSMIFLGRRYIAAKYINRSVFLYMLSTALMAAALVSIHLTLECEVALKLTVEIAVGITVYAAMLTVTRESLFIKLINDARGLLKQKRDN